MQSWTAAVPVSFLVDLADEAFILACAYMAVRLALQLVAVPPKRGAPRAPLAPSPTAAEAKTCLRLPVAGAAAAKGKPSIGRAARNHQGRSLLPCDAEPEQATSSLEDATLVGTWSITKTKHEEAYWRQNLSIELQPSVDSVQPGSQEPWRVGSVKLGNNSTGRVLNRRLLWDAATNCLHFDLYGKQYKFTSSWARGDSVFVRWRCQGQQDVVWQRPVAGTGGEVCRGMWWATAGQGAESGGVRPWHGQCLEGTAEGGGNALKTREWQSRGERPARSAAAAGANEAVAGLTGGDLECLKPVAPAESRHAAEEEVPAVWASGLSHPDHPCWTARMREKERKGSASSRTSSTTSVSTCPSASTCPSSSSWGLDLSPRGRRSAWEGAAPPEEAARPEEVAAVDALRTASRIQAVERTRRRWGARPSTMEARR